MCIHCDTRKIKTRICFTFLAKNFSGVCLYIYIGHQNVKFMSVLTDGSQARKTGSDKEMVLIRTERAGE